MTQEAEGKNMSKTRSFDLGVKLEVSDREEMWRMQVEVAVGDFICRARRSY